MTQRAPTRRRRAPLSRERVLRAAVDLADEAGEVPSMRTLAKQLGVEAMSLYNHVANKDDLLDGMIDLVWEEVELPRVEIDWRAAMRDRATSMREALERHPWAVGLMEARKNPGPANLRHHEAMLGCLREGGFSPKNSVHAMSLQDSFIYGFALQQRTLGFRTEDSAAVAEASAAGIAALQERYPYLAEVVAGHVAVAGFDFAEEFDFGLDLILDGLAPFRDEA